MNIQVGTKLSIYQEGLEGYIAAYYVGEKNGHHVALTYHKTESAYIEEINEQNDIKVRYFESDVRYEFKSRIIERLEEPVDLIVLEYPSEIYSVDKRNLERINCLVSAKVKNPVDDAPPVVGVIANINKTGCLCNLTEIEDDKKLFSIGEQVELKCQFPGLVGEQSAEGKVVRVQGEGKDIILGIEFNKEVWWVPPYNRK